MQEALDFIKKYWTFAVSPHVNPDGDAIGATLGLVDILNSIGKKAWAFNESMVPASLAFLPGAGGIIHSIEDLPQVEAIIVLDCGDMDRPGPGFKKYIARKPLLNIDHHATNTIFGDANWVWPEASSTGEMIVDLAHGLAARIGAEAALCLYTAILTDTGSFHFRNTTAKTLRAAAEMVEAGADPEKASFGFYHSRPAHYLPLLSSFLNTMEYGNNNQRADAWLSMKDYQKLGAGPDMSENFINLLTDVADVKVAIFYRELAPQSWKVSMRSKGDIDVAAIAKSLGGGGHKNAAGVNVAGSLDQVKIMIRAEVGKLLG